MMKKLFGLLLAIAIMLSAVLGVFANSEITLNCNLTCEERNLVYKQTNDIITVTYTLQNITDATAKFLVESHTNEIYYDPEFFEYVEGSATVSNQVIQTVKLQEWSWGARSVSFNGDAKSKMWASNQFVGTFQLKVIATEGSSTIYSTPVIKSTGTGAYYNCTKTDLTVTIGKDISFVTEVHDYANGKKLVLVYTNNDEISFSYKEDTMYDVTSKGYEYVGDEEFDWNNDTTKVYAIVVDEITNATLDDYKANVTLIYESISSDKVILAPTLGLEYDLNKSGYIDIGDPISAYGVFYGDSELYPSYMELILRTDVNNDKCINEEDTNCFENAYISTKTKS